MKRTAGWALGAVVALALAAGCDGSTDDPGAGPGSGATTDPSASASTDPGPVVTCPDDVALDPDPALPDAVPDGATSVRLCAAAPGEVTPPLDALTTNVSGVVQAVNDQPVVTRHCSDRQLPTYQLAFGYPDGTSFVVAGRYTECGELLVGSARRARAAPVLDRFVRALKTQRAGLPRPSSSVRAADLDCAQPPERFTWPLADPTELAVAVLCVGAIDEPAKARRATIGSDDLAVLERNMATSTTSTEGMFCPYNPRGRWIVGVNGWGDPITMEAGCVGFGLHGAEVWIPRGRARAIVQDLASRAR
ncbi:hypothetical protein [Nocardioides sp. MH1]|uniref:hypothetical protein n=1 Tax=Nocardioides sp. MH1 TaxID=3242490 RepID=UPI00351F90F8